MSPNTLMIYLGVLIALFIIVFIIMGIGYVRSSGRRRSANSPDALKVEAERKPVADQLQQYPSRNMADARGEDVGGNFSRVARDQKSQSESASDSGR